MFFHPSFIFDDLFFEVASGQCLAFGEIPDLYYLHSQLPEGTYRPHYFLGGTGML